MPFKIRPSKYRHVFGNPHKEDVCYKNIKITKNAHDSAFCAVNPKFVAVVTEECGGGAFIVIPIKHKGRIDINMPKVSGHRGPVLDLKWNPFNDNEIASCSEDSTIKVWHIADHGLYENLNEWIVDLHGHQRKVGQIEWHPTAENVMLSSSADFQVILWNLEKAEPIRIIMCHNDTIQSMNWSRDGSFFATTCKDKTIRIIDPRSGTVLAQGPGHQGSKISKVIILGCGTKLFTSGFSKLSERQIALWDIKDLSKPIQMEVVDCSSGILLPYYDHDTKIVFVAGKGDGNIRYYELTDTDPYIHYLSEYKSSAPQRGLGFMPKRGLDVTKNEIFRFYKLHTTGGICEPISMIVPRKSEVFQEDIYPDTLSGIPSLSCDEWIAGENREPILASMKDGAVPFMPKIVTYKQLAYPEMGTNFSRAYGYGIGSLHRNDKFKAHTAYSNDNKNATLGHSHKILDEESRVNLPIAEVMPSARNSGNGSFGLNKNFHKLSSSSNNSSPPLSPSLNNKHPRLNSDGSNGSPNMNSSLILEHTSHKDNGEDPASSSSNTDSSSAFAGGRASSNESMNQSDDHVFHRTDNKGSFSSSNHGVHGVPKQASEDIEASYLTNCSKNPIMLRKTESLKLDSVQSLRNRFNRISTNNVHHLLNSTGTRNSKVNNFEHDSNGHIMPDFENGHEQCHLTISPVSRMTESNGTGGSLTSPLTQLTSSGSIGSSTSSTSSSASSASNGGGPLSNYSEYFGNQMNGSSMISNANGICVKKRVWTPVNNSPNGSNCTNGILSSPSQSSRSTLMNNANGNQHAQFSELQKSYHRILDEKNSLREQLTLQEKRNKQKDEEIDNLHKRIKQLENKLQTISLDNCKRIETTDTDC